MVQDDIAPEHHHVPARFHFAVDLLEEVEIHPCGAPLAYGRRAAPAAVRIFQLDRFVAPDVDVLRPKAR